MDRFHMEEKKKNKSRAVNATGKVAAAEQIDNKRAADRHKVQCRKRPSGRYARGVRKGTWAQTEIEFNMVVAAKDAQINAKDAAIKSKDAEIDALHVQINNLEDKLMGANMQLAASRAVAHGWKTKWRRDNPSGLSNSESSDESWELPGPAR